MIGTLLAVLALDTSAQDLLELQRTARLQQLAGVWQATIGDAVVALTIREDGSADLGDQTGTLDVAATTLTVPAFASEYRFAVNRSVLQLSGGGLVGTVDFRRRGGALRLNVLARPLTQVDRAVRPEVLLTILVVVIAARVLIALARRLSLALIYSEAGPLGRLYRTGRGRARTFHFLLLNVLKYVIYLTSIGLVLAELGVNVTAYLASLSVIGLAIGFGSQGLVQDMVTGFFLIFESQFDVGDMVETAGQSGLVQEIGLRMTSLRTYVGQRVTIPNRNIAVVANYSSQGLRARIDVATARTDLEGMQDVVSRVAAEVSTQFSGVVLREPTLEPVELESERWYTRAHLAIWPGQQWLIDQQLIPRIKERCADRGLTIPHDRITVFYHLVAPVETGRHRDQSGGEGPVTASEP